MRLIAAAMAVLLACANAQASQSDDEQADILFKSGLVAIQQGQFDVAVATLRRLAQTTPVPRVKLELARALYLSGKYREALALFRQVYDAEGTPQTVKRNILPFMEAAELRIVRVRYGMRMITDSNPSLVAEGGTIYFNGMPLQYQPPVAKKTAYGIEPWLTVEKLWHGDILTKFYGSARLFKDNGNGLNAGRAQFAVARQVPSLPGLFVQAALDEQVGRNAYTMPSVEAWKRFRLSDTASVGVGGQLGYIDLKVVRNASGAYYRPYVFGDWTVLPNATLFGGYSVERIDSRNTYYSYTNQKVIAGVALSIARFDITPQFAYSRADFREFDVFWGVTRNDTTVRPEIRLSSERFEWNGIRPEFSVFYERRDSNIDIFDYDQVGGSVNLRKLF